MRSMTGFGEATREGRSSAVTVSLRAVNHRFFDLQLRMSDELRRCESEVRDLLAREVARGRVEARVDVRPLSAGEAVVTVHHGVVRAAYDAIQPLVEAGLVERGLAVGDLLRLPEALRVEVGGGFAEDDLPLVLAVAQDALVQLVAAREAEGASLTKVLAERLGALETVVGRL
ncbi:MAG TPA: YicC/YloC family endoribonuclease, partial [Thermoanaerobaculia bacterium]